MKQDDPTTTRDRLAPIALPAALEARTTRAAARVLESPWRRRLPDLALALYTLAEIVHTLRTVQVLP